MKVREISLIVLFVFMLSDCGFYTKKTELNNVDPYSELIKGEYTLKVDCFIFEYRDQKGKMFIIPADDPMLTIPSVNISLRYCQLDCVKFFSANFLRKGRFLGTCPMGFFLQLTSIFTQTKASSV